MDASFFDKESWKRAMIPAFRTFAYMTMLYVLIAIVIYLPVWLLSGVGVDLTFLASWLGAPALVLSFFLAFFKVLDEMRPGDIQLQMA